MLSANFLFKLIFITLLFYVIVRQIYYTIISWLPFSELKDEYRRIVENQKRKYPFVQKSFFEWLFFYSNQPKFMMWFIRIFSPILLIAFLLFFLSYFQILFQL